MLLQFNYCANCWTSIIECFLSRNDAAPAVWQMCTEVITQTIHLCLSPIQRWIVSGCSETCKMRSNPSDELNSLEQESWGSPPWSRRCCALLIFCLSAARRCRRRQFIGICWRWPFRPTSEDGGHKSASRYCRYSQFFADTRSFWWTGIIGYIGCRYLLRTLRIQIGHTRIVRNGSIGQEDIRYRIGKTSSVFANKI